MHLPTFNSDIIVILVIVLSGVYAMLGGAGRLRNLILSNYVGIVLAQTYTAILSPIAKGVKADELSLILLAAPIIVFMVMHKGHPAKGNGLVNLILGLAAGILIVAAALRVIAPSTASEMSSNSFLAMEIEAFSLWIIGVMPLLAVLPEMLEKTKKRDHH